MASIPPIPPGPREGRGVPSGAHGLAARILKDKRSDRRMRRVSRGGAFLHPEVADEIERLRERDATEDEL